MPVNNKSKPYEQVILSLSLSLLVFSTLQLKSQNLIHYNELLNQQSEISQIPDTLAGKKKKMFERDFSFWEYRSGDKVGSNTMDFTLTQIQNIDFCQSGEKWIPKGPGLENHQQQRLGLVSTVVYQNFDPQNPNSSTRIFMGTNASGFWIGERGNSEWHWRCTSDDELNLPNIGVQAIAVNPNNTNEVLIGTGTAAFNKENHLNQFGLGIWKSTNGGEDFIPVKYFNPSQKMVTRKIKYDPKNDNRIFAAINDEIFRSVDGGDTWTSYLEIPGNTSGDKFNYIIDFEIDPNANSIFISTMGFGEANTFRTGRLYVCTNYLATTPVLVDLTTTVVESNHLSNPLGGVTFGMLSIPPGDNGNLYYLYNRIVDYTVEPTLVQQDLNIKRINMSSLISTTIPSLLEFSNAPNSGTGKVTFETDFGGDRFYIGGIGLNRYSLLTNQTNENFNQMELSSFAGWETFHVDMRGMSRYFDANDQPYFLIGNDGGITSLTTPDFTQQSINENLNGPGLNISQFYFARTANRNKNLITCGAQDNGVFVKTENDWVFTGSFGDGVTSFFNQTANEGDFSLFSSYVGGEGRRGDYQSYNESNLAGFPVPNHSLTMSLLHGAVQSPNSDRNYFYTNYGSVHHFQGNQNGLGGAVLTTSHPNMQNCGGDGTADCKMADIAIDIDNPQNLAVCKSGYQSDENDVYFISDDEGATWDPITFSSTSENDLLYAIGHYFPTSITIHPNNLDVLYAGYGNFDKQANKHFRVFKITKNSSGTWDHENISYNLPNVPVNNLEYYRDYGLFAATDFGVYYLSEGNTEWECYSNGLPTTIIADIYINYNCGPILTAATFGRGVYEVELPYNTSTQKFKKIPSVQTFWSNQTIDLTENLLIEQGKELVITNCTVNIASKKKILIEAGGKLIIDNSTLTNYCKGSLWKGIKVLGNKNLIQNETNQGVVEIRNNSLIENAEIGVSLWYDYTNTLSSGSYIIAQNSTFRNNQWDIEFPPYQNKHANGTLAKDKSRIYGCTFEKTAPLTGGGVYNHMISLWKRNGISINNSTFRVTDPTILQQAVENTPHAHSGTYLTGIYSIDSDLDLASSCAYLPQSGTLCPEQDLLANTFENLYNGVFIEKVERNPVDRVHQAKFINCRYGIRVNAVNNIKATRNFFYFEPLTGIDMSTYTPLKLAVGINISNANGYQVQENEVTGLGSNYFNKTTGSRQFGFRAFNTGGADNKITNNKAQAIFGGFLGQGENHLTSINESKGLRFLCNENTGNGWDITSSQHPQVATALNGIAKLQKQGNLPAGNTFSQNPFYNITHYVNTTKTGITYTYYDNEVTKEPTHRMNSVLIQDVGNQNTCISDLENGTVDIGFKRGHNGLLPSIKNEFRNATNQWINTLYNLNQLIDGGQTNTLLTQVQNTWPEGAAMLRDDLLAESPYLSMDVLMGVIHEDILPHAMLYQVLLANPDVSSSYEFIEFLYSETQLPLYMIQNLETLSDVETPRTLLENDLAAASFTRTQAAIHIVNYYKTDTVPDSHSSDSIKYYLKQLSTFEGYLQLAETYFEEGDVTTANSNIDTLIANFELTTEQLNEANNYKQLNSVRNGITAENRTIYELTDGEINTLQQISDASSLFAGGIARAILRQNGVPNEPWVYVPNTNVPKRVAVRIKSEENEQVAAIESINKVELYPNPTSRDFTVDLDVFENNATLKVYSVAGSMVYNQNLKSGNQTIKVSTEGWSKGIYFIKVVQNGNILFEEKLSLH